MPLEVTEYLQQLRAEADDLGIKVDFRLGEAALEERIQEFKMEKVKEFDEMKENEALPEPGEDVLAEAPTILENVEPEPDPEPAPPPPPTSPVVMAPVHAQAEFAKPPKREIPHDVRKALEELGGYSIGRVNIVSRYIESLL